MALHLNESLRLRRIACLARNKSAVLDIGWAQMPNPFLDNPWVTGFDLAAPPLPQNYHEAISGDALTLAAALPGRRFDAVIAGEILEHVENPHGFLRGCREVLQDDGILILSTPNPNSPIERLLTLTLSRRFFYTQDHLLLYPQRWLIRMLENSGFHNVKLSSGGFPLPPFGLVPFPRCWCHQTIAVASRAAA